MIDDESVEGTEVFADERVFKLKINN